MITVSECDKVSEYNMVLEYDKNVGIQQKCQNTIEVSEYDGIQHKC